jgi:sugar phosphate permease
MEGPRNPIPAESNSDHHVEMEAYVASRAWRSVFLMAFFISSALSIPSLKWLRELRPENCISTHSLVVPNGDDAFDGVLHNHQSPVKRPNFFLIILRLMRKPKFWVLAILSPCLTLIRETLATWTQVLLVDLLGITDSSAAMMSLIFPLFGTVSTLLGGWAIDKSTPFRRGFIPVFCLFFLTIALAMTAHVATYGGNNQHPFGIGFLIMLLSLALMAPFSFVDGLFILSLVGKSGQGIAVGLINCIGYIGAIMAGHAMGSLAESSGWGAVFNLLTTISLCSCVLASLYWWFDLKELNSGGGRAERLRSVDAEPTVL